MRNLSTITHHAASFRDPSGFVFESDGILLRAVHPDAIADVETLFSSGLHDALVADGLLVAHRRPEIDSSLLPEGWMVLEPERLPVISYACEWTDSQLLAAARLTLEVQRRALKHGMSLKDASSFNVQFLGAMPVFIDMLSFVRIEPVRAWPAYRQFCEHFLAPLALRRFQPGAFSSTPTLDGIPLPVASRLLPAKTWLVLPLALHVHLHAATTRAAEGKERSGQARVDAATTTEFRARLTASLAAALKRVAPQPIASPWTAYRANNVYSTTSASTKLAFVKRVAAQTAARRALDLGANDGHYALALVAMGVACTAVEVDSACSERLYAMSSAAPYATALNVLRLDLTNPTPAHGWAHRERAAFAERLRCDLTLALALVHHLSITHQVPFERIASFLAELAPNAIVEYVPVQDVMSQQLLSARDGVTEAYLETLSRPSFEAAFARWFDCRDRSESLEGGRTLYHFERSR